MISMHTSPLAQPGQGDAGGMNVYVRNLSQAIMNAGHQVLAFTRKSSGSDRIISLDEQTNSKLIPIAAGQLKLPKEALGTLTGQFAEQMQREISKYAMHNVILHSHYWLSGLVAIQAAATLKCPVVHTMHTLGAAKNQLAPGTEPDYRIENEAYIAAKAAVLTANTTVEKFELITHTGVHEQRVKVVHPGVDHQTFRPHGHINWPGKQTSESLRILFAGRFQKFKGPHILLDALAILRNRNRPDLPVIHFTGASSGSGSYDLNARAHLLGVTQYCSFSPPVSPETLASYMRAADLVAMPSVAETFGLVAVESQACGTPVIAHRSGGLTTAVEDRLTGILVDSLEPHDWAGAIESVLDQRSLLAEFSKAGIGHAQQFSWAAMGQRMLEIYDAALCQTAVSR